MKHLSMCAFLLCACSGAHEVAIVAHSEDPGQVMVAASRRAEQFAVAAHNEHPGEALAAALRRPEEVEVGPADCKGGDTAHSTRLPSGSLRSLELVRTRSFDPSRPVSGWRMLVDSERGPGSIVRFDRPAGECYVGAGAFQGWPESTLRRAYGWFSPTTQAVEPFLQLD